MGKTKKTNHDCWACEPMFRDAVNCIDELQDYIYEIKNCERDTDISEMKSEMIRCLTNAVSSLEEVDDTVEWVTEYEEGITEEDAGIELVSYVDPRTVNQTYDIDPAGGYGLHSHI